MQRYKINKKYHLDFKNRQGKRINGLFNGKLKMEN
jgi:hypothetical protein